MSHNVVTVEGIIAVSHLSKILQTPYSSFPVLNSSGNIVGIIGKNFIIKLIELHHWVNPDKLDSRQRARLPIVFRRSKLDKSGVSPTSPGPAKLDKNDSWFEDEALEDS